VVVNLGPESVESWAPGYAFVTSSRPKRADKGYAMIREQHLRLVAWIRYYRHQQHCCS